MSPRARLASAWTIVILGLCWLPRPYLPENERLPKSFFVPNFDKLVHFGIFAIFSFLWMRVGLGSRPGVKVFLAGLALAAISEIGQNNSIVNRDGNAVDGLADMIGVALGLLAFALYRKALERRRVQPEG